MAYSIVLDTSAAIDLLKKGDKTVIKAIDDELPSEVFITGITRFELGTYVKDENIIDLIPCISGSCDSLSAASRMYRDLRKKGKVPSLPECIIAAVTIDVDGVLITRDRGFRQFREYGLKVKIV